MASVLGAQSVGLQGTFAKSATPVLNQFCFKCHSSKRAKGDINLKTLAGSAQFAADFRSWELVVAALEEREMPPEDEPQPSDEQRQQLAQAIKDELRHTLQ